WVRRWRKLGGAGGAQACVDQRDVDAGGKRGAPQVVGQPAGKWRRLRPGVCVRDRAPRRPARSLLRGQLATIALGQLSSVRRQEECAITAPARRVETSMPAARFGEPTSLSSTFRR